MLGFRWESADSIHIRSIRNQIRFIDLELDTHVTVYGDYPDSLIALWEYNPQVKKRAMELATDMKGNRIQYEKISKHGQNRPAVWVDIDGRRRISNWTEKVESIDSN